MESITEMIEQGWRVYQLSMCHKVMHLKQIRVYRYPDLIFVRDKIKNY